MSYTPEMINSMFLNSLENGNNIKTAATKFAGYIRDVLRDVQFSRKIIPPVAVSQGDRGVQVSTQHDGLVYMDEIEPESSAMAATWVTQPTTTYIRAKRYEVPFFQITSPEYETTEQELLASRYPVHKIIESNTVKEIGSIEDLRFLILCEAALAATGQIIKGTATNAGVASGDIQIDDIINLKNQLVNERRPGKVILINDADYNKTLKWTADDVGYDVKTQIVYGTRLPEVFYGLKVVRTAKTNLLREGNIYLFSTPDFLGRFFTLGNTKFFLKKERDLISWSSWEFIAQSIANAWSVAKLEIYSGSSQALPTEESLFTSRITNPPVAYPAIVQY